MRVRDPRATNPINPMAIHVIAKLISATAAGS
jgi:hypothetical protein